LNVAIGATWFLRKVSLGFWRSGGNRPDTVVWPIQYPFSLIPSPVDQRLGIRQLVIVADAYLHEVPFAALRPLQGGRREYLGLRRDEHGFHIVYAPSSTIFDHWLRRPSTPRSAGARSAALFIDPLGDLSEENPALGETFTAVDAALRNRDFEVAAFEQIKATPDSWLKEARERDLIIYF
jgi:hypothetical protein